MTAQPRTRARRFRQRVAETYTDLSPADLEAIDEAAATLDLIERLTAAVSEVDDLTEIRQGGRRVRSEVVELRQQREVLRKMLARFPALTDEGV
ncbi:hypothetical protein [Nocardioides houyundeii]|uniref:hypothetical protein n=1 Tax=Nocardioides houyundeii TaxID=2045452 RepID=UPI001315518D|nr:hypothetical protein [Nocardioides houyundeii]